MELFDFKMNRIKKIVFYRLIFFCSLIFYNYKLITIYKFVILLFTFPTNSFNVKAETPLNNLIKYDHLSLENLL